MRSDWMARHPQFPWLSSDDVAGVERILHDRELIDPALGVTGVAKAGEGNMNLTLRVTTEAGTVIVKQARPWVEKYDAIDAPWDRVLFEARFYARVASIPAVAERMPSLIGTDAEARMLVLSDLSEAHDLTHVYTGGALRGQTLRELAVYAAALHAGTRGAADPTFANREMRTLNHAHIYDIPLRPDNGLDLDRFEPGLSTIARELQRDDRYVQAVRDTGKRYLADGDCLIHGDFFPGSWMADERKVYVIDPEFCFYGDAEYDLGNAAAHLALSGHSILALRDLLDAYTESCDRLLDDEWLARYAACEAMRRLIGVAQLPIPPSDGRRAQLLRRSREVIEERSLEPLWDAS